MLTDHVHMTSAKFLDFVTKVDFTINDVLFSLAEWLHWPKQQLWCVAQACATQCAGCLGLLCLALRGQALLLRIADGRLVRALALCQQGRGFEPRLDLFVSAGGVMPTVIPIKEWEAAVYTRIVRQ